MFLKGEQVFLRALEPADADLLYEWENDMSLWPVSDTIVPFSRFVLSEFVKDATRDIYDARQLRLMIAQTNSGEAVGALDLFDFSPLHHRAGIGLVIHEKYRRKGFALETLHLAQHYAFYTLMLHQLYCNIGKSNSESIALFQKAGYEITGTKKEWMKRPESWEDVLFLQLLR